MSGVRAVHQIVGSSHPGNAVFDHACALHEAIRGRGFESWIYAADRRRYAGGRVRPLSTYKAAPLGDELLILHYALANFATDWAKTVSSPMILYYHNVTPAEFMVGVGGPLHEASRRGRAELPLFRHQTRLALAVSAFNERDLIAAGYQKTAVLPILLPPALLEVTPDPAIRRGPGLTLLFVGRLIPNKRVEDLMKLLYNLRRLAPEVHLNLVGAETQAPRYTAWLREFAADHGMIDAVTFAGQVSLAALAAYYRTADFFVTLSDHEGFCVPLIESMRFDLPVVANASSAIPETLAGAGILVRQKNYPVLAEVLLAVHEDAALREQLLMRQRERAAAFAPAVIRDRFQQHLHQVIQTI